MPALADPNDVLLEVFVTFCSTPVCVCVRTCCDPLSTWHLVGDGATQRIRHITTTGSVAVAVAVAVVCFLVLRQSLS